MNDELQIKRRRRAVKASQTVLSVRSGVPFPIIGLFEHPERIERYQRQIDAALQAMEAEQQTPTPQAIAA